MFCAGNEDRQLPEFFLCQCFEVILFDSSCVRLNTPPDFFPSVLFFSYFPVSSKIICIAIKTLTVYTQSNDREYEYPSWRKVLSCYVHWTKTKSTPLEVEPRTFPTPFWCSYYWTAGRLMTSEALLCVIRLLHAADQRHVRWWPRTWLLSGTRVFSCVFRDGDYIFFHLSHFIMFIIVIKGSNGRG